MTDRADLPEPPDVDPAVELASALLDGEVTADERALADDPQVQAHVEALGAVAGRVGEAPPVPEGLLDQHVAAALDAFDDRHRPASDDAVVPLARRTGGRTWWQRAPLGAVAAVVVFVALIGVVGLASLGDGGGDDTATADLDTAGDSSEAFSATEESAALEDGAGTGGSRALPSYAGLDELADELAARHEVRRQAADGGADPDEGTDVAEGTAPAAGTTSEQVGPAGCDAVAAAGVDRDQVLDIARALVDDTEVIAVVHGDPDAPRLLVVADGTCEVLADREL